MREELGTMRLLSLSSSFRTALHNLIRQNHIETGGNVSKDQVMLILIMLIAQVTLD